MAELTPEPTTPAPAAEPTLAEKLTANLTAQNPAPADTVLTEPLAITLKDRVAELGFADVKDDSEATERLLTAYKQQKEIAEEVRRTLAELRQPGQEFQTAKPTEAERRAPWQGPQIDKQLIGQYRTAEGWKDGTPEAVKQQYAAWQSHRESIAERFLDDPSQVIGELIDQRAEAKVRELMQHTEAARTEQQQLHKIITDNPWVYETDPVTKQPKVDPTTRSFVLSADGALINEHFAELLHAGLPAEKAWAYAHTAFQAAKAARQPSRADIEAENQRRKETLLERANGGALPARGASLPTPSNNGRTQNKRLRVGEKLTAQFQRDGVAP